MDELNDFEKNCSGVMPGIASVRKDRTLALSSKLSSRSRKSGGLYDPPCFWSLPRPMLLPLLTDSDMTGLREDVAIAPLPLRSELPVAPGRAQLAKEQIDSFEPFRGCAKRTLMMRSLGRIFADLRSDEEDGAAASRIDLLDLWYVALYCLDRQLRE